MSGSWDWVCLSPKKFKAPLAESIKAADELKVVVFHSSDFDFAEQHADLVKSSCELRLQPEWSKASKFTPEIIDYVKSHPKWNISLQTHKFMDIP
jgi:organic radical activating enzyme